MDLNDCQGVVRRGCVIPFEDMRKRFLLNRNDERIPRPAYHRRDCGGSERIRVAQKMGYSRQAETEPEGYDQIINKRPGHIH